MTVGVPVEVEVGVKVAVAGVVPVGVVVAVLVGVEVGVALGVLVAEEVGVAEGMGVAVGAGAELPGEEGLELLPGHPAWRQAKLARITTAHGRKCRFIVYPQSGNPTAFKKRCLANIQRFRVKSAANKKSWRLT